MKTVAVVVLCFFILNTLTEKFQTHAKHDIETRRDLTDIKLPDLDVSLLSVFSY